MVRRRADAPSLVRARAQPHCVPAHSERSARSIICLKTFATNDALRQHYESKHPGKDPDSTKKVRRSVWRGAGMPSCSAQDGQALCPVCPFPQVYASTTEMVTTKVEGGFHEDIFEKDLSSSDDEDGPPRVVAVVDEKGGTQLLVHCPWYALARLTDHPSTPLGPAIKQAPARS